MAAEGMPFSWRGNGGTIFTNLDGIWEMSAERVRLMDFDLIVKGGTVATAADTFESDIAIRDGRIVALGHDLGSADRDIDAGGNATSTAR